MRTRHSGNDIIETLILTYRNWCNYLTITYKNRCDYLTSNQHHKELWHDCSRGTCAIRCYRQQNNSANQGIQRKEKKIPQTKTRPVTLNSRIKEVDNIKYILQKRKIDMSKVFINHEMKKIQREGWLRSGVANLCRKNLSTDRDNPSSLGERVQPQTRQYDISPQIENG